MRIILLLATIFLLLSAPYTYASNTEWKQISERAAAYTDIPALTRDNRGVLHVAYIERSSVSSAAIKARTILSNGVATLPKTVVDRWSRISSPDMVIVDDLPTLFWSGKKDASTPDGIWAAQRDRYNWKTYTTPITQSISTIQSTHVSVASGLDGTPWIAWSNDFIFGLHVGLAQSGFNVEQNQPCCSLAMSIQSDAVSGEIWSFARSTTPDLVGITARRIYPDDTTKPLLLNQSSVNGNAVTRATRMPLAAPTKGGIYVAYCATTPQCKTIRVSNQKDQGFNLTLKTPARAESIALATANDGRIWLMWADTSSVWAVRSNRLATRWGSPVQLLTPPRTTSIWHATGEATLGPLDIFLNASMGGKTLLWNRRIFPKLTITQPPAITRNATMQVIRIKTSDAGDGVRTNVIFRGAVRRSTPDGVATIIIPPDTPAGRYPLTATATGYESASSSLLIK